jgi:hypothetical protein
MKRRIAVVGDKLAGGGTVLPNEENIDFTFEGNQAALIGGKAYCATCKSSGIIAKAGGPARLSYMGTREIALDHDILLCKCARHPLIIAVHAGDSTVDDEAEKYASAMSTSGSASDARTQTVGTFDEQVATRARSASLHGYPFVVETPGGQTVCGRVDSNGRLPRVHTDSANVYSIHWGDEALSHKDWK